MRIIANAPSRISLFGGGTDVNPYAKEYGGCVINMAINLYQKVELIIDEDGENDLPKDADITLCYQILKKFNLSYAKVRSAFDGVIGAGLGSSASFSVALIGAIDRGIDQNRSKYEIAQKAWEIEVNDLGWHGGKQDQWAACYGGFNGMQIRDNVSLIPLKKEWAEHIFPYMTLFYIGGKRDSRKIQEGFKTLTSQQIKYLHRIKTSVFEAICLISEKDVEGIGKLMHEAWEWKKESNKGVSNQYIDKLYHEAMKSGAWGGKVIGAGGAGYMIFITPLQKKNKLIASLSVFGAKHVDFGIDWNGLIVRRL